jgi:hypothetical protein
LIGTAYTVQDFIDDAPSSEVWDENWDVLSLYRQYSTQWRMGGHGPAALDFLVFFHELDRKRVSEDEYDDYVDKLQIIESEAIKWIYR